MNEDPQDHEVFMVTMHYTWVYAASVYFHPVV